MMAVFLLFPARAFAGIGFNPISGGIDFNMMGEGALSVSPSGFVGIGKYPSANLDVNGGANAASGYAFKISNTPMVSSFGTNFYLYDANGRFAAASGSNNTSVGYGSLDALSTGGGNTAAGYNALTNTTSGNRNTIFGYQGAVSATDSNSLVSISPINSMYYIRGSSNIGVGYAGLEGVAGYRGGFSNIGFGYTAVDNVYDGNFNIGLGYLAMPSVGDRSRAIAIGYNTMAAYYSSNTDSIGIGSLYSMRYADGNRNIGIGFSDLNTTKTNDNVAFGFGVLRDNNNGWANVGVGAQSFAFSRDGNYSTALGYYSFYDGNVINNSLAMGALSLRSASFGSGNTSLGAYSSYTLKNGMNNTSIGYSAGYLWLDGNFNVAVGNKSAYFGVLSSNITAIGSNSGYNDIFGSNNTFLGGASDMNTGLVPHYYSAAIGAMATVMPSNSMVLGSIDANALNVGINTANPANRLNVIGDLNVSVARDSAAPSLYVNSADGNVGVASINPGKKLDVNGTGTFAEDLNVSTGARRGASFSADKNRVCFPSDSCEMMADWNGTTMFFGQR